ncbi:hypothetical protein HU200_060045 [Digitaria exilis]|uniref:Uncharacterized protein n=1 Tax=Digitaria exilis TaxID=1010633 RepID=A0A835AFB5_9POAL|nr:hypothetical protein HU200_060045 [Digitaria exilis]CAB3470441.1 unnamed protein product [Digitaria exilis]
MIIVAAPSAHVLRYHHLRPIPSPPGHRRHRLAYHHRRRVLSVARAAARRDDHDAAAPESSLMATTTTATKQQEAKPAASSWLQQLSSNKDYSHTLFHSECLEVLGLVDLESLRKRPRLTVGVTVKASVVLPVLVVLAVLYLSDMAKGVVDWTAHHHHHPEPEGDDVGD